MTLSDINTIMQSGAIGVIIILAGLIKVPTLEINFWKLLGRTLGRTINGEIMVKVDKLSDDLEAHIKQEELDTMRFTRQRILRFNDEVITGKRHSQEHFDEILNDINIYEAYCSDHPEFKNNKAVIAIETIKEVYKDCIEDHDFLVWEKKSKTS